MKIAPASVFDLTKTLGHDGKPRHINRRAFGLYALQIAQSVSVSISTDAGELCLVAGIYPQNDHWEAWFSPTPALKAHLRAAFRTLIEFMQTVILASDAHEVRAYVARNSVAGHRLAAWCQLEQDQAHDDNDIVVYRRRF